MAKRKIDLSLTFAAFDGENLYKTEKDKEDFTLKDGLLTYFRSSQAMGMTDEEMNSIFILGQLVGPSEGFIELTTSQYDVIKKLSDKGKMSPGPGQDPEYIFGIEARLGIKKAIDEAEIVKDPAPVAPPAA